MPRYAIYYTPSPDSPLWRFGSSVLRYDSVTGAEFAPQTYAIPGIDARTDVSSEPRRYGFHATLKAPFELAAGTDEALLVAHSRAFARTTASVHIGKLAVDVLGSFIALRPVDAVGSAKSIGETCVRSFEPFRAPLSGQDLARRLKSPLTSRQRAYLDQWGYPYVFEEFRFHMTLTSSLDPVVCERVKAALRELYAPIDASIVLDAISIVKQPSRSERFTVLERIPLFKEQD